jgi:hypothetical protein
VSAPTPVSVTQTLLGALTANPTLNLDGASVAGDRTIVVAAFGRNRPQGITWPAPWTEPLDITNTNGNSMIQSWGWRDGATGASVQLTTTATQAVWAQAFRFAAGTFDPAQPPVFATAVNTGDAPLLDPPWGVEEWLAIVSLTRDGSLGTITYPLPNNQLSTNAGIFGSAAVCTGPITADSYNPAAWVATTTGTVVTAGLRGPAAAAPETGELAYVLPAVELAVEGTAQADGEAALVLPAVSLALEGSAAASGALEAVLPAVAAAVEASASSTGAVAYELPPVELAVAGSAAADGVVDLVLPAVELAAEATSSAAAEGAWTLPAVELQLDGVADTPPAAVLAYMLPAVDLHLEAQTETLIAAVAFTLPAITLAVAGRSGDEMIPLCEPWPLPTSCPAPTGTAESLLAASEDLWALSGRQFGSCTVPLRPCHRSCTPDGWRPRSWWDGQGWPALRSSALWWDAVCGRCRGGCGCNDADELLLPAATTSIVEVVVDGVVVPADAYVLWAGDGRAVLTRTDGERWPLCQDWTVPVSGEGAWSIQAVIGTPPPASGAWAVAQLSAEYAKWCETGRCALPAYTVSTSRQGTEQKFPTIKERREGQSTGLALVDRFLDTWNPGRLVERPVFINPDTWEQQGRHLLQGGGS